MDGATSCLPIRSIILFRSASLIQHNSSPEGYDARLPVQHHRQHGGMIDREHAEREASMAAATIDSQRVKTTGSSRPRGHDAGKMINGRKRHARVPAKRPSS